LILSVVCIVPLLGGSYLAITGMQSHSSYSGIAQAVGAVCLLGAAGYAALTSAMVWLWASSPKQVLRIHGALLGLGLLALLARRLLRF
jgi:hypothetical protein